MHTWEESLADFAFLNAATGSTDLVRVEGGMDTCFSFFSVKTFDVENLIGEIRYVWWTGGGFFFRFPSYDARDVLAL